MANRKRQGTLEERVLNYFLANKLIRPGGKVVAAVSGGPDSVCLLHILWRLQNELPISLHIAHLNHSLRGEEAEEDARYVAGLAEKLGVQATIEKRAVKAFQKTHRLSLEEAAREVRYAYLAEIMETTGADCVATGHTLNDQAETILLHIIRGAGTRGLRGLQPAQTLRFADKKINLIRPLLAIGREETEAYCRRHRLAPHQDSTNQSLDLLRNRVRHELLPLLKDYNSGIIDALLRVSRIAADDLAVLDMESAKAWDKTVICNEGVFLFNKKALASMAPALQRQLLRRAIEEFLGTLKDIETRHIEEALGLLGKPAGKSINLPEGLVFSSGYDCFRLGYPTDLPSSFPALTGEHRLNIPGVTFLPGWRIEVEISKPDFIDDIRDNSNPFSACLDLEKTGREITVRGLREGDRFQPLGMVQEKKVARFMLDNRIPREWRTRIPIFNSPEQILWIAGYRIDERVKVTSCTREILCFRMIRD